ncbi:DUF3347 domain-containing protein [Mucilaginibacter myungsuensis]|uniref:DUF3347 domain-containing protein n=1 Tax=Mucilaginibacter myungsuensis TaxID=649104 RepID=A0A929KWR5_9SPHI|nr:DUF3347 domain-containing protein [Mucilaginibacter myungsuensis]MBE9661873.1 DUF3347 domain-containing protein [Mucilaginibacter myungsuensis]MDN3599693.1 DUF3347 domain-containing protein [Mucilaginibacter myungsuensis]
MKTIKILTITLLIAIGAQVKAADSTVLSAVTKAYFGMKDALATDNAKTATEQAKAFTSAVKAVDASKFNAEQKAAWTKYADKLSTTGTKINTAKDMDQQREHFLTLSDDFYALIKATQANDVTIYRQYCPMKKAYWLSQTSRITNPYYGKEMDECGEVKETIKAK